MPHSDSHYSVYPVRAAFILKESWKKKKRERTRKTEKKAEISRKRNQDRHMTVTWQGKEEPNNPGSDFDSLSPVILLN